jgi:pSer/pThr/pTyr-binding forkhead associated (FHA) protein
MRPLGKDLGVLRPVGGGDPIPLLKNELTIGRRPSCDIQLDFENISGKHCMLRMNNGVWTIRDLGSTNGTSVNGSRISTEQTVLPDEEVSIAGRLFLIDYEPSGPEAFLSSHKDLVEDVSAERQRTSLMDLAGLDTDDAKLKRPKSAPNVIERLSADQAEFDDAVPKHFKPAAKPKKAANNDDDFFKLIEEDVK